MSNIQNVQTQIPTTIATQTGQGDGLKTTSAKEPVPLLGGESVTVSQPMSDLEKPAIRPLRFLHDSAPSAPAKTARSSIFPRGTGGGWISPPSTRWGLGSAAFLPHPALGIRWKRDKPVPCTRPRRSAALPASGINANGRRVCPGGPGCVWAARQGFFFSASAQSLRFPSRSLAHFTIALSGYFGLALRLREKSCLAKHDSVAFPSAVLSRPGRAGFRGADSWPGGDSAKRIHA